MDTKTTGGEVKVLIGYDGSKCAQAALHDLTRAGLPKDAHALVLTVADLVIEEPYGLMVFSDQVPVRVPQDVVARAQETAHRAMAAARRTADEGARMVSQMFPKWNVRCEGVADSPYWALITRAEVWPADLVVVGSHGRSALGRYFLGSVSQNVLSHAESSVRIGRCRTEAAEANSPVKLILAVDGSPDSTLAVRALAARAWPDGTEVWVVTAVDPRLMTATGLLLTRAWESGETFLDFARHHTDGVASRLRDAGLRAVGVVLEGDPKKAILDEAERVAADCIFLGARGHTRLDRFLLGSVSAAIASRAHCSVEVARTRREAVAE